MKFSLKQKYDYHKSRDRSPAKHGLKYGSPKSIYSSGFVDSFHQIDNSHAVKKEFGSRCSFAYKQGQRRGKKAARAYALKTGKPSFTIDNFK